MFRNTENDQADTARAGLRLAGLAVALLLATGPLLGPASAVCVGCPYVMPYVSWRECYAVYLDGVRIADCILLTARTVNVTAEGNGVTCPVDCALGLTVAQGPFWAAVAASPEEGTYSVGARHLLA